VLLQVLTHVWSAVVQDGNVAVQEAGPDGGGSGSKRGAKRMRLSEGSQHGGSDLQEQRGGSAADSSTSTGTDAPISSRTRKRL
jgi:hypothetical protein